jgi:hypothetical protein
VVLGGLALSPSGAPQLQMELVIQSYPLACPVSSFSLDSMARDPRELWRFLMQNLSLPNSTAQALLAAHVHPPEVMYCSGHECSWGGA